MVGVPPSSSRRYWYQTSVIRELGGAREMRIRVKGRNSRRGRGGREMARYSTVGTLWLSRLSRRELHVPPDSFSLSSFSFSAKDAPAPRREVSPGHSGVSVRSIQF